MPSHLSCIGLSTASKEEFQEFLTRIAEDAVSTETQEGFLLSWKDPSGASIYMHLSRDASFECMTPSFFGTTQHRVRPSKILPDKDCRFCDVLEVEVVDEDGQLFYPLLLQLEDMEIARSRIAFQTIHQLRVTGFAEEAHFWPTEEAFLQSQSHQKVKFATQSFFASGMFNPPFTPNAIFTGRVLQADLRTNSENGGRFLHLLVDSLGGVYDVVLDPPDQPVQPGAIAQCSCWMVGSITNGNH